MPPVIFFGSGDCAGSIPVAEFPVGYFYHPTTPLYNPYPAGLNYEVNDK